MLAKCVSRTPIMVHTELCTVKYVWNTTFFVVRYIARMIIIALIIFVEIFIEMVNMFEKYWFLFRLIV